MEDYTTVLFAAGAAIGLIIAATVVWAIVRRRQRRRAFDAPLPLIPFSPSRAGAPPPPPRPFAAGRTSPDATNGATPVYTRAVGGANGRDGGHERFAPAPAVDVHYADVAHDTGPMVRGPSFGADPVPEASRPPSVAADGGDGALADTALPHAAADSTVEGTSVRYWRPADGTLQFLPGRLEVITGRDTGHEIRFVRTPGPDGTRVTFGRAEGAPYRHIQLREPTVSRSHARMTLENAPSPGNSTSSPVAHWRLENLSATNPVVVNGRPLGTGGGEASAVALVDGDRIEMGEVVFRFHER